MDTKQEIKKNEDLIKSLESKRTDIFTFMAKEIKGNPRLEKAVEDLAIVNGALEKAYVAKGELEKAAAQEQADLEKAQKEQEEDLEKKQDKDPDEGQKEQDKDPDEEALEKAKDELTNEICEAMRAEKEFNDEYVKGLADKYSMSTDDIEDAIAAAIEANGGADA